MPRKNSPSRRQPNTFFIVDKGLVYALRGDTEYRILNSVVRDVFELEPKELDNSSAWLSEREFQRLKPRVLRDKYGMETTIASILNPKSPTRRNSKSPWKKGKMVWRRTEKRFSGRYQREYTAIGTIYPNKRNQYPYRWSVRVMDSSGKEASGYAKTLKNAKKSVDKHLDAFKRHNPTRRNSNHLGKWRSSFQRPDPFFAGVLRSSFFAPEDFNGAKLFLAYEDGSYVVRTRFVDFYRSRKVTPNTKRGRETLARAEKIFEKLLLTGKR